MHSIAVCGFDPDFANLSDEIGIHDFVPESVSVFAQLLMEKESMMAWNEFIAQSEEEQQSFLRSVVMDSSSDSESGDEDDVPSPGARRRQRRRRGCCDRSQGRVGEEDSPRDKEGEARTTASQDQERKQRKHPAFSPETSFARIDERIKKILRKSRRIPTVSSLTPSFPSFLLSPVLLSSFSLPLSLTHQQDESLASKVRQSLSFSRIHFLPSLFGAELLLLLLLA